MEKYRKKQLISTLKEGDLVDDIFVVKIKKGLLPYTKGYYFQLILSDNTGKTLDYKFWGDHDQDRMRGIYSSIKSDSVVRVQGRISVYNDKLQLACSDENLLQVLEEGQYDNEDFVKSARKNLDEMYSKLKEAVNEVQDEHIKLLLVNVFNDPEMEARFKKHPGAIEIHHNWIGGLLEHTLEVLNYCKLSCEFFPQLNKDLLIAGALLHDIGKLDELDVTSRIKGTTHGQLTGHLVLGTIYIHKKMDEIEGFDEKLKNKILHLLVSHHGKMEYGSPKEPMFAEAFALYYADEMSSKIAAMTEFIEGAKDDTEDDFMFYMRDRRNLYLR